MGRLVADWAVIWGKHCSASPDPSALESFLDLGTNWFWILSNQGKSNEALSRKNLVENAARVSKGMNLKQTGKTSRPVSNTPRKLQTPEERMVRVSPHLCCRQSWEEYTATVTCGPRLYLLLWKQADRWSSVVRWLPYLGISWTSQVSRNNLKINIELPTPPTCRPVKTWNPPGLLTSSFHTKRGMLVLQ